MTKKSAEQNLTKEEIAFFDALWGKEDMHVGLFRPKTLSIKEAREKTTEKMTKLLPKIAKSTRMMVADAGYGTVAHHIFDTYGCKIDCINEDAQQNKVNQKAIVKKEAEKKMNVTEASLLETPFDFTTFDIIWAQESLSKIEDKKKAMREVHRILKPEGRLIFTDIMLSDDCPDEVAKKLQSNPLYKELVTQDQYEFLARKSFLQKIYTLVLPEQLVLYLDAYLKEIKEKGDKLEKKAGAATVKKLTKHYRQLHKAAKDGHLEWGILIFQKINV